MVGILDGTGTLNAVMGNVQAPVNIFYYDAECRFCVALARLLERLDRGRALELRAGLDEDARWAGLAEANLERSAYLILPGGQTLEGFFAFRRLSLLVPLLWPFAPLLWLPGSGVLGPRVYRWVANNRRGIFGCARDG